METLIGLIVLLAGAGGGLLLQKATISAIGKRVNPIPKHWLIDGIMAKMIWALVMGYGCLGFYLNFGLDMKTLEGIYILSAILVLSAVDFIIRKIPNGILAALLIGAVGFMALGHSFSSIGSHISGMLMAISIFMFPFRFGKTAGAGDIKYAAVIGFFLGVYYTIVAFAVMSVVYISYVIVLLLSKKGNLKTQTALGPYLSFGFLFAFLLL